MPRRNLLGRIDHHIVPAPQEYRRERTVAVFAALKDQLSPGETDDVRAQLPKDLKAVWEEF